MKKLGFSFFFYLKKIMKVKNHHKLPHNMEKQINIHFVTTK